MFDTQDYLYVPAINPATKNNASFDALPICKTGYSHATFLLSVHTTDAAYSAVKVQYSADGVNSWTDVTTPFTAALSGTTGDSRLPQLSDPKKVFSIDMPLDLVAGAYIRLLATVGTGVATGSSASAVCILSRGTKSKSFGTYSNGSSGFSGNAGANFPAIS